MITSILLVDDTPDILDFMKYYLSSLKYSVVTASSKDEMNKKLEVAIPNLIILDFRLGEHNGGELCRQLKLQIPGVPIILTSASPQHLKYYLLYGADGILEKPFNLDELARVIVEALQQ